MLNSARVCVLPSKYNKEREVEREWKCHKEIIIMGAIEFWQEWVRDWRPDYRSDGEWKKDELMEQLDIHMQKNWI